MKKRYKIRISDILGMALLLSMALYFLAEILSRGDETSVASLCFEMLWQLPVYLVPVGLIFLMGRKCGLPFPKLDTTKLGYSESTMLTVSSFGAIVLAQVLYGSVFPSTFHSVGVENADSVWNFLLLFFSAVVLPAVLKELLFRAVILRSLTTYRALLAILMSSLVSALMMFSTTGFPLGFLCGFLLGSVYYATGSAGAAVGVHLMTNSVWFLAETVNVYAPERYALFLKVLVCASVLLFAFGLPFLQKTVQTLLADEHDDAVLPSAHFWGIPISVFFVLAILAQIFGGTF